MEVTGSDKDVFFEIGLTKFHALDIPAVSRPMFLAMIVG